MNRLYQFIRLEKPSFQERIDPIDLLRVVIVKRLRRKLGDDADEPAYIFTKRRAGYWMEKGETPGREAQ